MRRGEPERQHDNTWTTPIFTDTNLRAFSCKNTSNTYIVISPETHLLVTRFQNAQEPRVGISQFICFIATSPIWTPGIEECRSEAIYMRSHSHCLLDASYTEFFHTLSAKSFLRLSYPSALPFPTMFTIDSLVHTFNSYS
jgi:hypothetical protein